MAASPVWLPTPIKTMFIFYMKHLKATNLWQKDYRIADPFYSSHVKGFTKEGASEQKLFSLLKVWQAFDFERICQ